MGFLNSGTSNSSNANFGMQGYNTHDEPSVGRGLMLSGSLAALSILLIGGAAYFALQNASETQNAAISRTSAPVVAQSAVTNTQDQGLATSMASKTMSAFKSPHDEKREAARLAILNHTDGPLEVLTLREVEELTGLGATTPKPATQAEVVASATEVQPSTPREPVVAATASEPVEIEDVVETAVAEPEVTPEVIPVAEVAPIADETPIAEDPAEIELASAIAAPAQALPLTDPETAMSCLDELRALADKSTIYFGSGSAQLDANGLNTLRNIGNLAADCPGAVVQVTGHSDSSGTDATNLALSWQRADNTMAALNLLGIDTSRFEAVGFGARAPYSQGDSSDPELDRRVEFQIRVTN